MSDLKWGYIDKSGDFVIEPKFDQASHFHEGMAAVRVGEQWGYIDQTGELQIGPQFENAGEFSHGLAQVTKDGKRGFIDHTGTVKISGYWDHAWNFKNGFSRITAGKRQAYLLPGGSLLGDRWYDWADDFSDGLALVRIDASGELWYISANGEIRLRFSIEGNFLTGFSDGLSRIETRNEARFGYMTTLGSITIKPQFGEAWDFHEGLAAVRLSADTKWGFINKGGEWVIPPAFDDVDCWFKEGRCSVQKGAEWLVLNLHGEEVFNQRFESSVSFMGGMAMIRMDDQTQMWNQNGDMIKSFPRSKVNWVGLFSDHTGLAPISLLETAT